MQSFLFLLDASAFEKVLHGGDIQSTTLVDGCLPRS
jgi:hypothetical protein